MSALPDDTALDMLSFALSGPGVFATAAFALSGIALLLSFAEIGQRKNSPSTYFFLRVTLPSSMQVEGPDGTVSNLREGENVLRFRSLEACTTVAKRLEGPDVEYSVLRTTATSIKEVFQYPQKLRAAGSKWPQDLVELRTETDLQARWAEYEQIDAYDDVDKEWSSLMKNMSPIQFTGRPECRLCAGTGKVRCFRCGGVGSREQFQCDCMQGKRACEWCSNQ
ncbi:hypothetical protein BWQ96_07753 [Gracilariopsis chorda]|uniref:Uncharacterized protein n=1 Tax=Gracilariopsis chorda TaxID=448386 RepID=A0A2V3IK99_9FLOR|nr:hypothetical protein BWQ96_07753 [Gracilariopsis chorda]|eukprot:PXF42491.1 hypothetical protein BWQ96_07753 [Gracilariopsis chorda]